jgi:hypothetical protein
MRTAKTSNPPAPPKVPWYVKVLGVVGNAIGNAKFGGR